MSPSTFLYLVKKILKLWSDFNRGRWHCLILKIFGLLNSTARTEQQCPRALFSISSKKFRNYGRIVVESDSTVGFLKFLVFRNQLIKPHTNVNGSDWVIDITKHDISWSRVYILGVFNRREIYIGIAIY